MAKTEIAKPGEVTPSRSRDIFSTMRGEMDRMFARFEDGWPTLFHREGVTVPELDVRDNTNPANRIYRWRHDVAPAR